MCVLQDESGYRWPRDDHPISRQPEYRYFIRLCSSAMHRLGLLRAFLVCYETSLWSRAVKWQGCGKGHLLEKKTIVEKWFLVVLFEIKIK